MKKILIGTALLAVIVSLLCAVGWHLIMDVETAPIVHHVRLTVTNNTGSNVTDAGFSDPSGRRIFSTGPIAAGQAREVGVDYNDDDCPEDFSFDQSGCTRYALLDEDVDRDGRSYTVTLRAHQAAVVYRNRDGVEKKLIREDPSTKPVVGP